MGKINPLAEGKKAPAFKLSDKDGTSHKLSDIKSNFVVLFFYPKDSTPGCTIEARGFSKELKKFEKLGAQIVGISGGDEKSKAKFCEKQKLTTLMLSDTDFKVSEKYGVFGPKTFMGKKFNGITRTTFVLDKNKKIIKLYDKVTPASHPKEVLDFLKSLKKSK